MKKIFIISIVLIIALFAQGQRIIKTVDIEEGQYTVNTIKVCDRDGDSVIVDFNNLPTGAIPFDTARLIKKLDPNECSGVEDCLTCFEETYTSWFSRTFEWTPNYLQNGQYQVEINAIDHRGKSDQAIYIINVSDKNRSPTL